MAGYVDVFSVFFFSSRRRHTRLVSDWSSDVCSSDLDVECATAQVEHDRQMHIVLLVQTICHCGQRRLTRQLEYAHTSLLGGETSVKIGRASCRERGEISEGGGAWKKKRREVRRSVCR